jgi:hypothetical protein
MSTKEQKDLYRENIRESEVGEKYPVLKREEIWFSNKFILQEPFEEWY